MGKQQRDNLRTELAKLGEISRRDERHGGRESDEFLAQNQRVAEAEKQVGLIENLVVRGGMD